MKHTGRYAVSELIEGQFEPGSRGRVLRNLVGIKSKREMDRVEGEELVRTFKKLIRVCDAKHRFSAADICGMHKGKKKQEYFAAVQSGFNRNYAPMEKIFDEVIETTVRLHEQSF